MTVPVGVGVPLTATFTVKDCVVVMLKVFGVTVTVGVALVTVTLVEEPVELL